MEGKKGLLSVGDRVSCRRENVDWGCVEGGVAVDREWEEDEDEDRDICEGLSREI